MYETSLNHVNNINPEYPKATKPVGKIVPKNRSFLKNKFNLEVTDVNERLPNAYWTSNILLYLSHSSIQRNYFRKLLQLHLS